jgi:DNA polymerase III subunit delta
MSKTTPTFYIFHGDDSLRIAEETEKMRAKMGTGSNADLNISEFDGTQTGVSEIMGAALAFPFLSDKRLVIVKDLLAHITRKGAGDTGKKAVDLLLDELPRLPEWTRLVFVEREQVKDSNKILKLAQTAPNGYEKSFSVPKDSTQWIIKRAQEAYSAVIEPVAANALASVTVGDLRRADNELFKLVSYVDGARPITEADVALLTPYVAEANLFAMVDALAEGRGGDAEKMLRALIKEPDDVFGIYGMVIRQFRLLLLVKEHLTGGGSPGDISEKLGISRFPAEKLAKQSRAFTVPQLERIYRTLHDYDVKMKTGRIKADLALDLLIAGLSR